MAKLKSRKLWAALVGVIVGVAAMFGLDEGVISTVSGAVMAVAAVVSYIVTEGRIDAAAVALAVDDINAVLDDLQPEEATESEAAE